MITFQSPVPVLSLGAIDTASAAIVILVAAGVALVAWGSRPSVIARYSVQNQRSVDAEGDEIPAAAASTSPEGKRPA